MCWYIPQTCWNPFEYIAKLTTSQITLSDHWHLVNLGGCWVQMRWAICRARLEARVRGVACVFLWFSKEVAVSFWKVLGNFLRWKTDEMNMTCCHIQVFSHPKVHSCWVTGLLSCEISHLWEVKMGKKRWVSNEIKWYRNIIVLGDGRNPKQPPGIYKTLWILGYLLQQLVQDFFHQQYVSYKCLNPSLNPPKEMAFFHGCEWILAVLIAR